MFGACFDLSTDCTAALDALAAFKPKDRHVFRSAQLEEARSEFVQVGLVIRKNQRATPFLHCAPDVRRDLLRSAGIIDQPLPNLVD